MSHIRPSAGPTPLPSASRNRRRWESRGRRRRRRARVLLKVSVALVLAAVALAPRLLEGVALSPTPAHAGMSAAVPNPIPASVVDATLLVAQVTADTPAGGSIAVVVQRADGTRLAASPDADRPRYTASLAKLLVVQQLLAQDDAGARELSDATVVDMSRAISRSDDAAMNRLWVEFDGAALVSAAAVDFGLTATAPPVVPGQWGESTTSPADYATVLTGLPTHLTSTSLATLLGWMQDASATAADGFDQAFGLRSPTVAAAGTVAVKQGWMCCVRDLRLLHSTGVLPDGTAVVLLGRFPVAVGWPTAQQALDHAARDVLAALAPS